ncbi:hypothetical protein KJ855_00700 [Patescibacteria group bacterium]|nr:hypothetical protein [Patescibacteria group bacterium]
MGVLILFLLQNGCQTNTSTKNSYQKSAQPDNPYLTYITIQKDQLPPYLATETSLESRIISTFPQATQLENIVAQNQENLGTQYHFFWQENPDQSIQYTLAINLEKNIDQQAITIPDNYYFIENPSLFILSTQISPPRDIQPPSNKSFLTIHNLSAYLLSLNPSTFQNHLLAQLIHHLSLYTPLEFFDTNNQVLINTSQAIIPSSNSQLEFPLSLPLPNTQIPSQSNISDNLRAMFNNSYLSIDDFLSTNLNLATIKLDSNQNPTIFFNYHDNKTSSDLFDYIYIILKNQKTYTNQTNTLPDNTFTTIHQIDDSNIELKYSKASIGYNNDLDQPVQIYKNQNQIIFSLSPETNSTSTITNQYIIPWPLLQQLIPTLSDINHFKSLQLRFQDNRFTGTLVK